MGFHSRVLLPQAFVWQGQAAASVSVTPPLQRPPRLFVLRTDGSGYELLSAEQASHFVLSLQTAVHTAHITFSCVHFAVILLTQAAVVGGCLHAGSEQRYQQLSYPAGSASTSRGAHVCVSLLCASLLTYFLTTALNQALHLHSKWR